MGNEIDSFKFTQLELKSNPIACKLIPPDFKPKVNPRRRSRRDVKWKLSLLEWENPSKRLNGTEILVLETGNCSRQGNEIFHNGSKEQLKEY